MTPADFLFPARRLRDLLHRETTDLAATVHQARALAADLVDAIEAAERRRQYLSQFAGDDCQTGQPDSIAHRFQRLGWGQGVLVRCRFFQGTFPHKRVFMIRPGNGSEWRSIAPLVQYCTNQDGGPLGDEPIPAHGIEGFVMGVVIGYRPHRISRVYLPNGEVYELSEDLIVPVRERDVFSGVARQHERRSTDGG
jgi:hypothetical protein